jgi:undecaprenyl-phosphate galactose phosphotransferase/putative colanic acid biosynthesis UDP-glucose lipid carrier transferase
MSVESSIRDKVEQIQYSIRSGASFPTGAVPYVLRTLDWLIILISCLVGGIGYHLLIGDPFDLLPLCAVGSLAGLVYILRMNGDGYDGYYGLQESAKPQLEAREILVCWFSTGLLLTLVAFLLKISAAYSRGAFIMFFILVPIALLAARKSTKIILSRGVASRTIGRRDTILMGDPSEIAALKKDDLMAFCGAPEVRRFSLSRKGDYLKGSSNDVATVNSAATFVRHHNCRQILLALPWNDTDRIEFIKEQIKSLPVAVRLVPDKSIRALSLSDSTWSGRKPGPMIELQRAPLSEIQRFVKRVVDIVAASIVLIFFLPIMVLTAIAIKLNSPGPVIFRQVRKGFNGKHFVIFKFRTMSVQENGPDVAQAKRNDSRVTTIGRLLRSSSIDELPQLWNVLRGDMSLIGPRPHALAHDNYFETMLGDYAFRHHVKPGITGWAQCNGSRGATPTIEDVAKRVKLDLWYINNWSLWLDFLIVVKTTFEVLRKRNAY